MPDLFAQPEADVTNSIATVPQNTNPMAMLAVLAESNASPEIVEKYMDLAERWQRNEAANKFADALTKFQSKCPRITKERTAGGGNFAYKFASYDDVMAKISGLLAECGLCLSFSTTNHDKGIRVTLTIRCGTHTQDSTLDVPIPDGLKINDTQKYGSALSYAKRYALCAALNIVTTDEDTDAHGLAETITDEQCVTIEEWLAQTSSNVPKFLAWLGVEKLAEIPAARYAEVIDTLKRKQAR